ncbi:MAG TPA: HAMP domain-containing sensor histidine kinase [Polyangia bacterium]|jgi:signal transduction histidine kinase
MRVTGVSLNGRLRSLSLKVALLLALAVGVTMFVATAVGVNITKREIESQVKQRALEATQDLAQEIERLPAEADEGRIKDVIDRALKRHRKLIDEVRYSCDEPADVGGDKVEMKVTLAEDRPQVKRTTRPPRPRPPRMTKVQVRTDGGVAWVMVPASQSARPPSTQPGRGGGRTASSQPVVAGGRTPASQPRGGREAARLEAARLAAAASQPAVAAAVPRVRPAPRPTRLHVKNPAGGGARTVDLQLDLDPPGPAKQAQLTTTASLEAVDRQARVQRQVFIEVGLAVMVALAGIALFISNRFVGRPLRQITEAMGEVERGDMTMRVLARGGDEVGTLASGFNQMVAELGRANAEIRAFNSRLAEEVRAATSDLSEKNDALGHLNRLLLETRRELGDKERLAALGQLAAQLAHEMGTPLSSVSGHLQLALADRGCPDGLKDRLKVATGELARISTIIRDYLDSTRPVAPAPRLTNLRQLAIEAAEIAALARGVSRKAETTVAAELETVRTDAALLRQILVNLLSNAHDAAGDAGHIHLTAELAAGQVVIRVSDDGPGIAAEDRRRIFEPFYTTKGRGRGTGLGLSICRELTRALGGHIDVDSEIGRGSTFMVTLPFDTLAATPADQAGSGRILVGGAEDSGQKLKPGRGIPS